MVDRIRWAFAFLTSKPRSLVIDDIAMIMDTENGIIHAKLWSEVRISKLIHSHEMPIRRSHRRLCWRTPKNEH